MPRFFTNEIDENNITLTGSDAVHVGRSLRMKPGEPLTVCCGDIRDHERYGLSFAERKGSMRG